CRRRPAYGLSERVRRKTRKCDQPARGGKVWRCQEPPEAIFAQLTSGSPDRAVTLTLRRAALSILGDEIAPNPFGVPACQEKKTVAVIAAVTLVGMGAGRLILRHVVKRQQHELGPTIGGLQSSRLTWSVNPIS